MNFKHRLLPIVVALVYGHFTLPTAYAACLDPPGDITGDGNASVSDVQCNILMNLWSLDGQTGSVPGCVKALGSPAALADHSCDGIINVADTLIAVGFALKSNLDLALDTNGNQCVDACETDIDGDGDFDVSDCAPLDAQVHLGAQEYCNGLDDDCDGVIDNLDVSEMNISCGNNNVCDGTEVCIPTVSPPGLFFSEWMIKPLYVPAGIGQWLEIYNGSATAQNIQGWQLQDGNTNIHIIDAGGAIFVPPRGYLVLSSSTNFGQNGGVKSSYAFAPFQLSAGFVKLVNPQGIEIDRIDYGLGPYADSTGASVAITTLQSNNNDPAVWQVSTKVYGIGHFGTPGGPNTDVALSGCASGPSPPGCDDGNPCTDDSCNPLVGCVFFDNAAPCDDNNDCTTVDLCDAAQCQGTVPKICDDANPCTDDVCIPPTGCTTSLNVAPCDDNNTCSVGDQCAFGVCTGGFPLDCNDQNPCTVDSCHPTTGCSHVCSCDCDCGCVFVDPACVQVAPLCCTDPNDNDADGFAACDDCDDTNGGVFPGVAEKCNGIDDDCDGLVDEGFDKDNDGYTPCAMEPQLVDCNDNVNTVSPGAPDVCGPSGTGNGVDDNCNGYVDEPCNNCDTADPDGDGHNVCQGDCMPNDPTVYPGAPELCDGKDNDCNKTTRASCDVSDPCNFNKNATPLDDNDVCMQDLVCVCTLDGVGQCSGNWQCTSFCNTSESGPVGDGCGENQVCTLQMQASANINGCAVAPTPPGVGAAGELCTTSAECRGLNCSKLCTGTSCINSYCVDVCLSDDYCPVNGTFCRLLRQTTTINGYCWPPDGPWLGTIKLGQPCSLDSSCDRGFCSQTTKQCASGCCTESDCPNGFYCSVLGDQIFANLVVTAANAPSCALNSQCQSALCFNGKCSYLLTETTPMCLRETSGQNNLQAGAACQQNTDCASNYCEKNLNVCVEPCCNDATCPTGLMCVAQLIEVTPDPVNGYKRTTNARVCLNLSTTAVIQRK
ncbi:MAG: lamin tail domain-containing protein [Myxococcales bacterium]|nr:lamin tail domain-containing protein [Myxococcales bacterium]